MKARMPALGTWGELAVQQERRAQADTPTEHSKARLFWALSLTTWSPFLGILSRGKKTKRLNQVESDECLSLGCWAKQKCGNFSGGQV